MRRLLLPLLLAVAVGGTLFFVLGEGLGGRSQRGIDRVAEEEGLPPELRGIGRRLGPRGPEGTETQTPEEPTSSRRADGREFGLIVVLEGVVVADDTGEPIEGASVWLEPHAEPCPRLTQMPIGPFLPRSTYGNPEGARTSAEGRFVLMALDSDPGVPPIFDLFVTAPGRVLAVVCSPARPGPVEIRLEQGLRLAGRVRRADGRPVPGAVVTARPGPETPQTPGHGSIQPARTNEEGAFELDGFRPGTVLLHVDHPLFMPGIHGPVEPADGMKLDVVLEPALRATFNLRTDDGRRPEHPTLIWETARRQEAPHALMLPLPQEDADAGREDALACGPVRLPANAGPLVLSVKADGYADWRSPPFRPRPEGGEETFEVTLTGDASTGSLRISLTDDLGGIVNAAQADVQVHLLALDADAKPAAFVVIPGADIQITALPAGAYRLRLTSAAFAPIEAEVVVSAGQERLASWRTRPPARVRVKFFAPEPTLVRFRLLRDGQVVEGIPEGSVPRGRDERTGEPILAAGEEGLLLSGLAAGTYAIEVTSEDLVAPTTVLHLAEDDVEEVEIRVSRR